MAAASRAAKAVGQPIEAGDVPVVSAADKPAPMAIWSIPNGQGEGEGGKAFVQPQNDVTASDIKLAVREAAIIRLSMSNAIPPPAWPQIRAKHQTSMRWQYWLNSWVRSIPKWAQPLSVCPIRRPLWV